MAYGLTSLRDDWIGHAGTRYGTSIANRGGDYSRLVMPHDFIGAQVGFGGSLINHGDFCAKVIPTSQNTNDTTVVRFLSTHMYRTASVPVDAQGVFMITNATNEYAGPCVNVERAGHAEGTVVCPVPASLVDGDNVVISDGTNSVTFWVDKTGTYVPGGGYDATNVRLLVQSLTTDVEVADALRAAIFAATLDCTTDGDGLATVTVLNRAYDDDDAGGFPTAVPITATAAFTVTGMDLLHFGGGTSILAPSRAYGYALTVSGATTVTLRHAVAQSAVAATNATLPVTTVKDNWVALRLTAHRIGDTMRLRGYYMTDLADINQMFTAPNWVPAIDVVHVQGSTTPIVGSAVPGQTLGSFGTTGIRAIGRAGFLGAKASGGGHEIYFSSIKITPGAV